MFNEAEDWDDISGIHTRQMPMQKPGRSKQDYGTPREFLRAVEDMLGEPIIFDLAASDHNRKAPSWYTQKDDALSQPWHKIHKDFGKACAGLPAASGWLWLNPPFGNIGKWASKCREEKDLGAKILFLVPASVGSNWFRDHVHGHATVLALNPRLIFEGETNGFPKDLMLCLYGLPPVFEVWPWCGRKEKARTAEKRP